jgi:hypothetical protein
VSRRKKLEVRVPKREAKPKAPPPAWWSAAVGFAAFGLYLWLAPPVSGDQDISELTLALATAGVPHPTGYPLYILAGHAFCVLLHAAGASWPYAANAWSALGGGVSIAFLHATAARLVPQEAAVGRFERFVLALLPSALLALNPVWTIFTALAEVHSWHLAWVGAVCLLFATILRTSSKPYAKAAGGSGRDGPAAAWGLACGLGLAHHLTSVLVAVPLTFVVALAWRRDRPIGARPIAIAAAAALLPLLSYSFVAYRAFHPARYQWPMLEPSVRGVMAHVLGMGYGGFLGRFAPADVQQRFLTSYVIPVLAPALLGLLIVIWRAQKPLQRLAWWGFLAALLAQLAFVLEYGVPDPVVYFLPAMWIGLLSLPSLLAMVLQKGALRSSVLTAAFFGVALVAGPWLRFATDRRDGFVTVAGHLRRLWQSIPAERAIVLWPSDMYTRFLEFQIFDGEKPDVFVINHDLLTFARPRQEFQRRFGIDPSRECKSKVTRTYCGSPPT